MGNHKKTDINGCAIGSFCGREAELEEVCEENPTVPGVFAPLINNRSFIDKLILGVDGTRRKRLSKNLQDTKNLAIGGPGRSYARTFRGTHGPTGNPLELKYGPNPKYRNLYDSKLILRSEAAPLCHAEAAEIIDELFRKGYRSALLGVEFTSDVSIPLRLFDNHILTRARSIRALEDAVGRKTLYTGAPGAEWNLRVYQKTRKTTRVEFVIANSFLKKRGIRDLADLGLLKDVPWSQLVRFPSICQRHLEEVIAGKVTGRQRDVVLGWPGRWPTAILLEVLGDYGIDGDQILRPSAVGRLLENMQRSFTWSARP